jgi:hypothetical protein
MSLFGWDNHIITHTLSASSESSAGPVANLQNDIGAIPWITNGSLSAYVRIDAGTAVTWRMGGVFRTNLTTDATVRFKLGTTAGGSDVYDSTALTGIRAGYGQLVKDFGQDFSARHCEIAIDDPGNPDGSLSVGLAYAGPAWAPSRSMSATSAFFREAGSNTLRSQGGQEFPSVDWRRRGWALEIEWLSEAEVMSDLVELDRISGDGRNVLYVPFPGGAYQQTEAVFGILAGEAITFSARSKLHRSWRGSIRERL